MSNEIPDSSKKHFSHMPKDWTLKKLEELVYQKITYGIVQPGKFDETGVPLIRGIDYMSGWKDMKSFFKVSKQLHTKFKRSTTKRGDVLLSIAGYAGHVSVVPNWVKEANITQTTARISISKDKALSDFVAHFLGCDEGKLQSRRYIKGSAQEGLNLDDVQQFLIPIPPLPEQKKIASILTSVDDVIETTQKQIDKLQDLKKATMNELLTKGIGHTEFKDSELGRIPKSWEVLHFAEVFSLQLGKMMNKQDREGGESHYPFLANQNVQWTNVDLTNLSTMNFSDRERAKFDLLFGDLLICEGGEVGRTAMWKNELRNCYFQKAIHRARLKNSKFNAFFFMYMMELFVKNGNFVKFIGQTSIAHLTKENLEKIPIPVPSDLEQSSIGDSLVSIDVAIDFHNKKLSQTQSLKKSLMQDLLTGKVRVRVH